MHNIVLKHRLKQLGITPMLNKAEALYTNAEFQNDVFVRDSFITMLDINQMENELINIKHTVEAALQFIKNQRAKGVEPYHQVPFTLLSDTDVVLDEAASKLCTMARKKVAVHEASSVAVNEFIEAFFSEEVLAIREVADFLARHSIHDDIFAGDLITIWDKGLYTYQGGMKAFNDKETIEVEEYLITSKVHWFHAIKEDVLKELSQND